MWVALANQRWCQQFLIDAWIQYVLFSAKTKPITLLSVPPKFNLDRSFKNTIIMKVKTSKVIEIPFAASPMPKITWAFNDGKFSDEKRITVETIHGMTALTISRAERRDAGDYTLKIENKFGTISMMIHVRVLGKYRVPTGS